MGTLKLVEAPAAFEERTRYDLEMIRTGVPAVVLKTTPVICLVAPGEPPPTLFEYIPPDAVCNFWMNPM